MGKKVVENQQPTRRTPVQDRSQAKIELILEAAIRILDQEGLEGFTTNRIAAVAGISIGTLYQYFTDKAAILDVLGQRELQEVTRKIVETLSTARADTPQQPARVLINAVFGAFGGRSRVHRILLENALLQGRIQAVDASPNQIAYLLATAGVPHADGGTLRLSPAEAFVLTHAFTGVTRAAIGPQAQGIGREEIQDALLKLVSSFVSASRQGGDAAQPASWG